MNAKLPKSAPSWVDRDDAPEITAAWVAAADLHAGDKLVRRGRPPKGSTKVLTTLRLDPDVLAGLRATGSGWQTRVNDAMREWLKTHSAV
ncbi:MAG: BrnA antitoxin family protein [Chitinophagaceae bacterium]|nr:BrnA antitoxin family protein [Polaromonas sp.]